MFGIKKLKSRIDRLESALIDISNEKLYKKYKKSIGAYFFYTEYTYISEYGNHKVGKLVSIDSTTNGLNLYFDSDFCETFIVSISPFNNCEKHLEKRITNDLR